MRQAFRLQPQQRRLEERLAEAGRKIEAGIDILIGELDHVGGQVTFTFIGFENVEQVGDFVSFVPVASCGCSIVRKHARKST